jgi:hypothetical protein
LLQAAQVGARRERPEEPEVTARRNLKTVARQDWQLFVCQGGGCQGPVLQKQD